jgi:hypothetical protein
MRGFAAYLVAGILVLLATDLIFPPVWLGLSVGARPATEHGATTQFVDRTHKGDRLSLPTAVGTQRIPQKPPAVMFGCDPPFSPLLASARVNSPGRCVAEMAHPLGG